MKLLTVQELADYLNVKVGWVYKAAAQGLIPSQKWGKYLRFDLNEVIDSRKQEVEGK